MTFEPSDFQFFDEHGYFPSELLKSERQRTDSLSRKRFGAGSYVLRDDEAIDDIIRLTEKHARPEPKMPAPKPTWPGHPAEVRACVRACVRARVTD